MILNILLALFIYDVLKVILGMLFYPEKEKNKKETFRGKLDRKIESKQ